MRKHLFLTTAILALLGTSPSVAQYAPYRPSDKPSVEINLGALDDAMEQKDHAERDVTAEALPPPVVTPAPVAQTEAQPQDMDKRPAAEELTEKVANPAPQGRQLLASTHDDMPAIREGNAPVAGAAVAEAPKAAYKPYLTAIPVAALATPAEPRVFQPAHPQVETAQNDTPPADAMKPIIEKSRPKPAKTPAVVKKAPAAEKIRLAQNDDFTPPAFEPKVVTPVDSGKPAIVSKPPSMPPAVLAPAHPVTAQPVINSPAPASVETPPAAPPAVVAEPTPLPAPAFAAPGPVVPPPPAAIPAPASEATDTNSIVTDHQATGPVEEPAAPVVPTMADLTLDFTGNSSDLTPDTQTKLNNIVKQVNEMDSGKLQVRGYATGEDGGKSSARRIALSRALSVRSYLMDKGVKPTRIDVRAMGSESDRTPLDRVDLIFNRE